MDFIFGGGYCRFVVFKGLVVFGADKDAGGFGDVHIECEFKVDFIVLFIDLEEQISSGVVFLLLFLHLFEHFLY